MFKLNLLSWSIGLFVPGNLGQFSIIYLLKKEGLELGESTAIVLLNKIITLISLSILSIFGFFLFLPYKEVLQLIIILILLGIIIFFFIMHEKGRTLIRKYILRKSSPKFEGFSKTLRKFYIEHPKRIIVNFLLTFIRWFLTALMMMFLFLSLGFKVNLLYIFLITPITIIISYIPISIGGLGLRESAAVFLYGIIGVNSVAVLGVYILSLLINGVIAITSLFFPLRNFKKEDLN